MFVQSFEVGNLQRLNRMTGVRLVQLVDANDVRLDGSIDSDGYGPYDFKASGDPRTYADLVTPMGLAQIATYADGVGPWKCRSLLPGYRRGFWGFSRHSRHRQSAAGNPNGVQVKM